MVAYALKFFPLIVQVILFRAVCFFIILILYRELKQLFLLRCKDNEAGLLSLAVIFLLRFVDPTLFAQLNNTHFTAFLAASV